MRKPFFSLILAIFLFAMFFPSSRADILSVNSGGNSQICISSGNYIEECFFGQEEGACVPLTCIALGYNCGNWNDGCGNIINCGTCASGYTCTAGICTAIVAPPGGGGGGGPIAKLLDLKVIPEEFNLVMRTNQILPAKIDVLNTGNNEMTISISVSNSLKDILSFEESLFSISAGGTKTLAFTINSPDEPGIYTGKIIMQSGQKILEIPFILNVRSEISLFDISLDIPPEQRIITAGDKITGQINLIQAGLQEKVDVSMHYIVKDFENNIYLEESETIMVYAQKSYGHDFNTQNLPPGNYVLGAEVIYEGGVATASYPFTVIEKRFDIMVLIYIILLVLLIFGIIIVLLIIKYYKRQNLRYNKERWKKR